MPERSWLRPVPEIEEPVDLGQPEVAGEIYKETPALSETPAESLAEAQETTTDEPEPLPQEPAAVETQAQSNSDISAIQLSTSALARLRAHGLIK